MSFYLQAFTVKLDKFVGRNERPTDKPAFDLISKLFSTLSANDIVAINRRKRNTVPTQPKSEQQKLFEDIRHFISAKHQVPTYLTTWELNFILSTLKNAPEERK